jgi:hypothetical protein
MVVSKKVLDAIWRAKPSTQVAEQFGRLYLISQFKVGPLTPFSPSLLSFSHDFFNRGGARLLNSGRITLRTPQVDYGKLWLETNSARTPYIQNGIWPLIQRALAFAGEERTGRITLPR